MKKGNGQLPVVPTEFTEHFEVNGIQMEHGSGKSHILTEEEFMKAMQQQRYDKVK